MTSLPKQEKPLGKKAEKNNSIESIKAGVWYTFCSFLLKGVAFITTPIFTRLLTKSDFGTVSNFTSWLSILGIIGTMHLYSSVARARYEYEDDFNGYLSSIVTLGSLYSGLLYIIVLCFPSFFESVFDLDMKYIHVLFFILIFSPAMDMMQIKHRYEFKYKLFVFISIFSTVVSTGIAVLMVTHMDDKLFGRIYGAYIPRILIYIAFFIIVLLNGKKFYVKEYWKFAFFYSIPIIPHLLAHVILGSSDKLMITKLVGKEATAVYSLAYSCGMIVSTLNGSLDKAISPWLYEKLHIKDYDTIKKVSRLYVLLSVIMVEGLILIAPETIFILGGDAYSEAKYLIPPVMLGYGFKFAYTLYINVEQFEKKTGIASIGTLISAGFNLVSNYIFIQIFGYQAAAYTTLAGYILLLLIHFFMSKRLGFTKMYDNRYVFTCLGVMLIVGLLSTALYTNNIVRYSVIAVLVVLGGILAYRIFKKKKPGII